MIEVIKFSGQREPFSQKKVYNSARRAGAKSQLAERIAEIVTGEVYDGIKTEEILKRVRALLRRENKKASLRFNLKKALRKLGPTGFPFEKYIAEVFFYLGFKTQNNLFLRGKCCTHEIDFTAKKDNLLYIGECKYRNLTAGKVDTKDSLANYARFLDLKPSFKNEVKSILVTNSKFTSRAIKYSQCVGVELLGWRYPKGRGLEKIIEENKLYPITVLPSLKNHQIPVFVESKIVMVKDLLKKGLRVNIPKGDLDKLIKEARILL